MAFFWMTGRGSATYVCVFVRCELGTGDENEKGCANYLTHHQRLIIILFRAFARGASLSAKPQLNGRYVLVEYR